MVEKKKKVITVKKAARQKKIGTGQVVEKGKDVNSQKKVATMNQNLIEQKTIQQEEV